VGGLSDRLVMRVMSEIQFTSHVWPPSLKSVSNLSLQAEAQTTNKPTAGMVEVLTTIWQRVLQRPCIGVDDNFFDLGGDSSLALRLFDEVMRTCCRQLSPVMIYQAPTIRALAMLLEGPCTTLGSPLALLKAGTATPPVFFAPSLSGNANFFDLARQTRTNHPIYGIWANQPFNRVEDMARHNVEVIKTIQPKGPYALIGYSFGGLVALEMSRCLLADGEDVALLALLDTYPHRRHLSLAQRLPLTLRRTRSHLSKVKRMPFGGALSYCVRGLQHRLHLVGLQTRPPADRRPSLPIEDGNYIALREYRPQFYPGKIKFVRAEANSFLPSDPMAVWGELVAQIEVETVPGDHREIVDRHYHNLSPLLSRYLEQAFDQRPR
jgi:thioesterase domain-containing protein